MKKIFTLLVLLIFMAVSLSGQKALPTVSNKPYNKIASQQRKHLPISTVPLGILQGGEDIGSALEILSLPFSEIGTTEGYADDYNEICPYSTSGPDVVYSYTPPADGSIDISLCNDATAYDTKLYVYDTPTPVTGDGIACNDDLCSTASFPNSWVSAVTGVPVIGGTTYYIVVDGYSSSDFGIYEILVTENVPCVWGVDVLCPVGATPENEVCGINSNDGCNMDPGFESWEPVPATGDTFCGTMYADNALGGRDTDWYELVVITASEVVLSADADQLIIYGLISGGTAGYLGNPDCATANSILPNANAGPCNATTLDLGLMNPGTYWFFVGMTVFDGFPCINNYYFGVQVTPVDCAPPYSLVADNITYTTANLTWTPGGSETEWEYAYGEAPFPEPAGSGTATSSNLVNPITGLTANTNYQFFARAVCGVDQFSSWAGPSSFFTGYCIPAPSSVDGLGITNVTFSSVNNTTVAEPGNYGDYSTLVGDVQQTTTVPVLITYQTGYTYDTKIWIDWNDDLDFSDAGEEVYTGTSLADNPTTLAASFIVPGSAILGNHRMRIGGIDFGTLIPCYTGSWGTFEDYTINVLEPPPCLAPTNLAANNITSASAELSWNGPVDSFFDVFFYPGSEPFTGTVYWSVNSPLTINDLEPGTEYGFNVRTDCGFDTPKVDYFWMAMDAPGNLLPPLSGGSMDDPGETGIWYLYNQAPGDADWWNIWFYNDPVDTSRMKKIRMGFWIQSFDNLNQGMLNYVINWSDTAWDGPGFPTPLDEGFIHRSPVNGPLPILPGAPMWVELYYIIPDYNPEWVSVDLWGDNIQILQESLQPPPAGSPLFQYWLPGSPGGIIVHECLPKVGGPTSAWAGPVLFTTLPQCPAPTNLAAGNITTNSAELSWNGPIDSFFDVFFDPGSEPFFGTVYWSVNSPLLVSGLEPGASYEWYVRTDCGFDAPNVDNFWMAMDAPGNLLPPLSGGSVDDPGETGLWYLYNQAPGDADWWNIWFYNDPVDTSRMKKIRMGFWIQPLDIISQGMLNYVINWSDSAWDGPGFPTPLDEAFIHRSPVNGPMPILPGAPMWVELYYIIPDYNPEWVSIDIWGENIQILQESLQPPPAGSPLAQYWLPGSPGGIIVHECLPKVGGPTSTWSGPILFTTLCPTFDLPLCESFDPPASDIPNCWTEQVEGLIVTPHWFISASNLAGGSDNEAVAVYYPGEGATVADNDRLVSPALNTTGMTSINLSFRQYLDDYNAGVNDVWVKVQSSSDGATWTDEWAYSAGLGVDILPETKNLVITSNLGGTTYLAWTLSGYTFDINSWHVDDICIYESCLVNTWTGSVSNAWNNPANWSCGILPNNLTTVVIPSGLTVYPTVPTGINAQCFDIEVGAGATVLVETGGTLNVVNP